jgi:hypothetical protein
MPAITGALFALAIAIFGWRTSLSRFYILALLSLALGIALTMLGLGQWRGVTAYYAAMGILLVGAGVCTLAAYLRANPKEEAE